MFLYKITNNINKKIYIGITNDYKRRWSNHKTSKTQVIGKAIQKYGLENFTFELLESGLDMQQASDKECQLILEYNCRVPYGYNVAKGGMYYIDPELTKRVGIQNGRALLSEEEVKYIKSNRDKPEYILYDSFSDKISYAAFKEIYLDKTYKNISPTCNIYPYNLEFSSQFTSNNKLDYPQVVELRNKYSKGIYWRDAYEDYKEILNEWTFRSIYKGDKYRLVMPEVFTEENENKHHQYQKALHSGENNGRSKLTKEDVIKIREMHSKGVANSEIYKLYPQVTITTIKNVINNKTWINI